MFTSGLSSTAIDHAEPANHERGIGHIGTIPHETRCSRGLRARVFLRSGALELPLTGSDGTILCLLKRLMSMELRNELVLTDTDRDVSGTLAREAGKLTAFIKARVRNAADAEDILQEVLFELVQAYQWPESIEQVGGWLVRVARNRIIDRFRRKKASSLSVSVQDPDGESGAPTLDFELPSLEGDPEGELTRLEFLAALQQALEELPSNQREVFVAHEIEGVSFESLSRRDGTPVNTLLARKRYAVLYLRKRLQGFYDEWET